ncbi:tripartite tricarboxylate transporter TctB family protein [Albirhodobacter sp. R86504]|uniref:tripartite tricarboxylate transporter TctB family protein n=1 Tax=Albirhodobacter sp. R86504 TaxID=3093848 RepID=UPI003670285C
MVVQESAGAQRMVSSAAPVRGEDNKARPLGREVELGETSGRGAPQKHVLRSTEARLTMAFLAGAALSLIFMGSMIAEPKALFGRSLATVSPALFPSIVLGVAVVLCIAALMVLRVGAVAPDSESLTKEEWVRGGVLFGIMALYALTMAPCGFLISSAITITLISLQMGSRSALGIAALALVGPVILYLTATKLLLVALPELGAIEMLYARLFSL